MLSPVCCSILTDCRSMVLDNVLSSISDPPTTLQTHSNDQAANLSDLLYLHPGLANVGTLCGETEVCQSGHAASRAELPFTVSLRIGNRSLLPTAIGVREYCGHPLAGHETQYLRHCAFCSSVPSNCDAQRQFLVTLLHMLIDGAQHARPTRSPQEVRTLKFTCVMSSNPSANAGSR